MAKKPVYDESSIVLYDKIYIPAVCVEEHRLEKHYIHHQYDESACRRCDNKVNRHNYICDSCEAFGGVVQTYNFVAKNGMDYFGLPIGDRNNIEKNLRIDFDEFNFIDRRIKPKFDYNIKLIDLVMRDYQEVAVTDWRKNRYGMIVAPPRSGKTPLSLFISVKLGIRTMMLANQHEFLTQFIDHVEEFTNLPALQEKYGVKLYGFAKKPEDYETIQIGVSTYQQFFDTEKGRSRFNMLRRNFGNFLVDEADKAASNEFAKVINNIPARYKTGFTGTDKRKDGKDKITEQILGPVISRIVIPQLQAKLIVHSCDYVKTKSMFKGKAGFVFCCKFLAKHKKRTAQIIEYVGKDLANGHSIVIPVYFKDHVANLVALINSEYGDGTAEAFVGGTTPKHKVLRAQILERAKSGKTKVIVGIRSILQRGLNVPRWSALYNIMPMNNEPNWKQESSRVLTPMENKRDPIIRLFVDPGVGLSLGCFVGTYKQSIGFDHKPTEKAKQQALELIQQHGGRHSARDMDSLENIYGFEVDTNKTSKKRAKAKPEPKGVGLFGKLQRLK